MLACSTCRTLAVLPIEEADAAPGLHRPTAPRTGGHCARRPENGAAYVGAMQTVAKDTPAAKQAEPRRLSRLFKVLVVGGAVLAAAYATALGGGTGTAGPQEGDDGGTQGW